MATGTPPEIRPSPALSGPISSGMLFQKGDGTVELQVPGDISKTHKLISTTDEQGHTKFYLVPNVTTQAGKTFAVMPWQLYNKGAPAVPAPSPQPLVVAATPTPSIRPPPAVSTGMTSPPVLVLPHRPVENNDNNDSTVLPTKSTPKASVPTTGCQGRAGVTPLKSILPSQNLVVLPKPNAQTSGHQSVVSAKSLISSVHSSLQNSSGRLISSTTMRKLPTVTKSVGNLQVVSRARVAAYVKKQFIGSVASALLNAKHVPPTKTDSTESVVPCTTEKKHMTKIVFQPDSTEIPSNCRPRVEELPEDEVSAKMEKTDALLGEQSQDVVDTTLNLNSIAPDDSAYSVLSEQIESVCKTSTPDSEDASLEDTSPYPMFLFSRAAASKLTSFADRSKQGDAVLGRKPVSPKHAKPQTVVNSTTPAGNPQVPLSGVPDPGKTTLVARVPAGFVLPPRVQKQQTVDNLTSQVSQMVRTCVAGGNMSGACTAVPVSMARTDALSQKQSNVCIVTSVNVPRMAVATVNLQSLIQSGVTVTPSIEKNVKLDSPRKIKWILSAPTQPVNKLNMAASSKLKELMFASQQRQPIPSQKISSTVPEDKTAENKTSAVKDYVSILSGLKNFPGSDVSAQKQLQSSLPANLRLSDPCQTSSGAKLATRLPLAVPENKQKPSSPSKPDTSPRSAHGIRIESVFSLQPVAVSETVKKPNKEGTLEVRELQTQGESNKRRFPNCTEILGAGTEQPLQEAAEQETDNSARDKTETLLKRCRDCKVVLKKIKRVARGVKHVSKLSRRYRDDCSKDCRQNFLESWTKFKHLHKLHSKNTAWIPSVSDSALAPSCSMAHCVASSVTSSTETLSWAPSALDSSASSVTSQTKAHSAVTYVANTPIRSLLKNRIMTASLTGLANAQSAASSVTGLAKTTPVPSTDLCLTKSHSLASSVEGLAKTASTIQSLQRQPNTLAAGSHLMIPLPVSVASFIRNSTNVRPTTCVAKPSQSVQEQNPQSKVYLMKIGDKQVLIPSAKSSSSPMAYVLAPSGVNVLPKVSTSLSVNQARVPSSKPSISAASSSADRIEVAPTVAKRTTVNSTLTTTTTSGPPIRIKEEPKTEGYGDETPSNSAKTVVKQEPVGLGYSDEATSYVGSKRKQDISFGSAKKQRLCTEEEEGEDENLGAPDSEPLPSSEISNSSSSVEKHASRIQMLKETLKKASENLEILRKRRNDIIKDQSS